MKKEFVEKVIHMGSVDTKNYRYVCKTVNGAGEQYQVISRLPLTLLDTTAALDSWEDVKVIK